jgi:serine/threonine-protein kinase
LQDVDTYVSNFAREGSLGLPDWGIGQDSFLALLRRKSEGNFMYLYYVLPAIERGEFRLDTPEDLPDGLVAYYQRHWRQMREGKGERFETVYAPIISILGVAEQPVAADEIANWTGLLAGQVREALDSWREFLQEERLDKRPTYRIYHASFQDFLTSQVPLTQYDEMIASYYLGLMSRK